MKSTIFGLVSFLLCLNLANTLEKYSSKSDNVDIDTILSNDRLVKNYKDCLVDKIKCPKDAIELKKTIPEALQTNCAKCTEKQREMVKKVVKYFTEKKPEWWKELTDKYDPEGIYKRKYEELNKQEGIRA